MLDYDAIVTQTLVLLQREQRLSYRVLKLRLQLDDDTLEALKEDLVVMKWTRPLCGSAAMSQHDFKTSEIM